MSDGPRVSTELLDSARQQQHASWTNGERVLVETLLDEYPSLHGEKDRIELIYSEFCLRESLGEDVAPADYLSRFPEHFDRLQRLFEVHEALGLEAPRAALVVDTESPDESATDEFATLPVDANQVAELQAAVRLDDYELLDEIARGGMGVVYKAWQRGAERIVALKMILAGHFASEIDIQRFRTEAQAAARLDHVNIVPIYAVGQHDQHPYFSMAYIDGESLAQRVARGPVDPKEACRFVHDIANAVHYAHQHGVAHRDLKPANILLTRAGVPKITDFGLAKRLEADGPTVTGDILGTPSYMAPEHARGDANHLETLSDVYSLGAILYCLLTGRPPFQAATVVETLAQVIEQEPVAPRQLNPAIDRDLQTICLKCLEKEPSRRYASAAELAEDLQRFLRGEAIHACPVTRVEHVWRWCKRKPLVAALATVSLLLASSLVAALAIGYFYQARLRRDAESARQLADANAETARGQADLALHTLERVVFDIQRKLEHVPAAQHVRRQMLRSVIEQLDRVASHLATNDWADHHTAVAHVELGDIFLAVDAAGETSGLERARREYEIANRAFLKMHEEEPDNDFVQHNLAISYGKLANVEKTLGRLKPALRLESQGFALLVELHERFPENPTYAKSLADATSCLGELHFNLGDVKSARESHEHSREILLQLVRGNPDHSDNLRSLAVVHNFLGTIYLRQSNLERAKESYQASLALRERLAGDSAGQDNLEAQFDLAVGLRRFGDVLLQQENVGQAEQYYQRSLDVISRAAEADSNHRVVQQQLAASHSKLGELALRTGQLDVAARHLKRVEQIDAELVRKNPHSYFDLMDWASAKQQLGDVSMRGGDLEQALSLYGEALAILDELQSRNSGSSLVMENIASTCLRLGDAHQRSGDLPAAARFFERELAVERALASDDPTDLTKQRGVSVALGRLGDLKSQAIELDDALAFYDESLGIARRLASVAPDDRRAQRDLLVSLGRIASTYQAGGEHQSAGQAFLEAVEVAERLAANDAHDIQALEDLASTCVGLAGHLRFAGDDTAAGEMLHKALAIREQLAERDPNDANAQYNLSVSHERLFELHWALGECERARPHVTACAELRERLAEVSSLDARLMRARMVAMDRQAWVCEHDGDADAARQQYERGIRVLENMLALDPSSVQTKIDLVGLTWRLGYSRQRQFDFVAARERFEQGLSTLRELERCGSLERMPLLKPYLEYFIAHIDVCTFYERVATDLDFTLAQDERRVGYLLYERCQILVSRSQYELAAATIETLAGLTPFVAENLYNAACACGLGVSALDEQARGRGLTDGETAWRQTLAVRAAELLDAAALHGYFLEGENADWLLQDPDFDTLREEFDFQQFVTSDD